MSLGELTTTSNTQVELQSIETVAKYAAKSGLYGGNEADIFMRLLAAKELNIPLTVALNGGLWNIKGKIEISARLMCSMIRRAGHSVRIVRCDKDACIIMGTRKDNGDSFEASFTIEDAKAAGLGGSDVWRKYAEDMLYARALSRLARRLFADVIGTAYVEGELQDPRDTKVIPMAEAEEIKPEETINRLMGQLLSRMEQSEHENAKEYLEKRSKFYKKGLDKECSNALTHFDTFMDEFSKWKKQHGKEVELVVASDK